MEIYTNGISTFVCKYNWVILLKVIPKKYIFYLEKNCHLILTLLLFLPIKMFYIMYRPQQLKKYFQ